MYMVRSVFSQERRTAMGHVSKGELEFTWSSSLMLPTFSQKTHIYLWSRKILMYRKISKAKITEVCTSTALVPFAVLPTVTIHACALGRKEKRKGKDRSNWETRRGTVFYSSIVCIKRHLQAKLFGIFYLTLISVSRLIFSGQWEKTKKEKKNRLL